MSLKRSSRLPALLSSSRHLITERGQHLTQELLAKRTTQYHPPVQGVLVYYVKCDTKCTSFFLGSESTLRKYVHCTESDKAGFHHTVVFHSLDQLVWPFKRDKRS